MARHRIIGLSCAPLSLKLLYDSIFVLPAAIYSLFHGFSSICTAVAPSLSHGTCRKTICMSRTCKLTVFVVHWRCFFVISTRHIERIRGAFCNDALYKLTFTFTGSSSASEAYSRQCTIQIRRYFTYLIYLLLLLPQNTMSVSYSVYICLFFVC